jgi:hypothetical protein
VRLLSSTTLPNKGHLLSDRLSYLLVVIVFLGAAVLRLSSLTTLPPGLAPGELNEIRLIETARQGRVEVYYTLDNAGHEGLYAAVVAAVTSVLGVGQTGYRITSVFAGLLALALLYAVGKRLFGALAGLSAAALMALGLFPSLLARSIQPEAFVPLFVTALLLALARSLPVYGLRTHHEPKTIPFAALGLLLGVGFYLHPVAYPASVMALGFIVLVLLARGLPGRRPLSRRTLSYTWFALVVLLVAATPYLIATLGEPHLSGSRRVFEEGWTPQSILDGLGGVIFVGDARPTLNLPGRPLFDLASGLVMGVGLLAALRFWRQPRCLLLLIGLAALLPVALLTPRAPDFSRFAALLPIMALLFGLGVSTLINSLPKALRLGVGVAGLVGLLAFNVGWTGRDLLVDYPAAPVVRETYQARLSEIARYLDRTIDQMPTVICSPTVRPPGGGSPLTETQIIALMMHRSTATVRYADCGTSLVLPEGGERGQVVLTQPGGLDRVSATVRFWLERGSFWWDGAIPPDAVVMLNAADALADRIGAFTTTAPAAFAPEAPGGQAVSAPPLRFGENVTFLGYERSWGEQYRPGDTVPIVTYWRIDGDIPPDLILFAHFQSDPGAAPVAQLDGIGVLPASLRPRDVLVQTSFVQLPWTTAPGTYLISLGAFRSSDERRLDVFDGEGASAVPRGTRVFIGDFRVTE